MAASADGPAAAGRWSTPVEPSRRRRVGRSSSVGTRARCPAIDRMVAGTSRGSALATLDRAVGRADVARAPSSLVALVVAPWSRLHRRRRSCAQRVRRCRSAPRSAAPCPFVVAACKRRSARLKRVRGAVPRGAGPAVARAPGRPRVPDRRWAWSADEMRRSRSGPSSRRRSTQQNFGLPLRGRARRADRAHPAARRAVLRHRRADPARDRRQPVGDPRQPGARRARALQDPPPGPRLHRARAASPATCCWRCRRCSRSRSRSSIPSTWSCCSTSAWGR